MSAPGRVRRTAGVRQGRPESAASQYAELWGAYRDALVARGFRVATFDLLGQGASDKPALFISQDDQVAALALLIDQLGDVPIFLGGISFGGLIALRYAIDHGDRLAGLALMSSFAELSPQLLLLGTALRTGLILGGTGYLQDLLLPMNLSDAWLGRCWTSSKRSSGRAG